MDYEVPLMCSILMRRHVHGFYEGTQSFGEFYDSHVSRKEKDNETEEGQKRV